MVHEITVSLYENWFETDGDAMQIVQILFERKWIDVQNIRINGFCMHTFVQFVEVLMAS